MLHTFKKGYVNSDEQRKTDRRLSNHINALTPNVKEGVTVATHILKDRKEDILRKHDEAMATSQQQIAEASRVYKETVDRHVGALQQSLQGTSSLAQGLKKQAEKLKKMVLSTHVVPSLKLDDKELGYVKQLKELQREHSVLLLEYERLQESKEGAVKQLNTAAREVNRETSQLIADLEERNKFLDQDKLVLEQKQVKLKKEVETLKRKRRNTPSPPPAKSAPTPTLRILRRGEKESPAAIETTLSLSSLPPPKSLGTGRKDGTSRHQVRKRKCQVPHALLTT
jgi:hypothetical protein